MGLGHCCCEHCIDLLPIKDFSDCALHNLPSWEETNSLGLCHGYDTLMSIMWWEQLCKVDVLILFCLFVMRSGIVGKPEEMPNSTGGTGAWGMILVLRLLCVCRQMKC